MTDYAEYPHTGYDIYYCPTCGGDIKTINGIKAKFNFRGFKFIGVVCKKCGTNLTKEEVEKL